MREMLDHALVYAARGWPVFRIQPGTKKPYAGSHGFQDAATNEILVTRMWDDKPDADIGLATGKIAEVWVLDIDGEDGSRNLTAMEAELGPLPETLEARTGSGGRHLFYRWPAGGREVRNKQALNGHKGIDVRGEGGYVVLAPSKHPSGGEYSWPYGQDTPIAEIPAIWLDEIAPAKRRPAPWERQEGAASPSPAPIGGTMILDRARRYLAECEPAVQGSGGHDALLWAARAMVVGFNLDDSTALSLLWSEFNPRCSPPWDMSSSSERRDFERKVQQARQTPGEKPAGWLLDEYGLRSSTDATANIVAGNRIANALLAKGRVEVEVVEGDDVLSEASLGAGQSDGGVAVAPTLADQSNGTPADRLGEQIRKAVEPILAGVNGPERLNGLRTLADCLRNAIDGERAGLRQWTQFPLDVLPRRVADFIRLVAEAHSVDESFVALPALATAGAAMGNAFRIRIKDGFDEPPSLWCFLVARTGCNKSGPLSLVIRPMWQTPPMPVGANSLLAVQQGQYVIDDATSEAVLSRLAECPRGLLLSGDELAGWLRSFDAYRKGVGGDEQKWCRIWDVNPYRVDRKASNERTTIHAPAVSIAGAIQPELLRQAVDPAKLASGFFARALVAQPPEQKRRWSNVGVSQEQADFWKGLVDSLRTTPFASLDPNAAQYLPNIVSPSPEAYAVWVRWFEESANLLHVSGGVERVITAKADRQTARLALVIFGMACALGELDWRSPMPEYIMSAAITLAKWFLNETIRVFDTTCGSAQDEKRTATLNLVLRLRSPVLPRDLQRANSRAYPNAEVAKNALMDLASAGYGVWDGKAFVAKQHGKPPP